MKTRWHQGLLAAVHSPSVEDGDVCAKYDRPMKGSDLNTSRYTPVSTFEGSERDWPMKLGEPSIAKYHRLGSLSNSFVRG